MGYYVLKLAVSALVIVIVSEIAKRNSAFAALIASLPLTSLLAIIWMHVEGSQVGEIAALSRQIFWLVLPSLVLFLTLPVLLRSGMAFWPGIGIASSLTILGYFLLMLILRRTGVNL